jgi:hypothetical protein
VALPDGQPSLLDDGDREIENVYDRENIILYWADWSSQGRTKFLVPARQPQRTNQGGISFICIL